MKKFIAAAAIVSIAASTITTPAQAASYKVVKGKLVDAKTGKVVKKTTVFKKKLYQKGMLAKGTVLYKGTLYVKGSIPKGYTLYKKTLYSKGKKHHGVNTYKKKLYVDGIEKEKNALFVHDEKLHQGEPLFQGMKLYEGFLYSNGYRYTGVYKQHYYHEGKDIYDGVLNDSMVTVRYTDDQSAIVRISGIPGNIKETSAQTVISTQGSPATWKFEKGAGQLGDLVFTFTGIQSNGSFNVTISSLFYGEGRGALNFNNKTFSFKSLLQLKSNADFNQLLNDVEKLKQVDADQGKWFVAESDALTERASRYESLFGDNGSTAQSNAALYYAAHQLNNDFKVLKKKYDGKYFK